MIIRKHSQFDKNFSKRIKPYPKLVEKFKKRYLIFETNQHDPVLEDHQLSGSKSHFRAFSIAGDIRVIYRVVGAEEVVFVDIGSHNQVY